MGRSSSTFTGLLIPANDSFDFSNEPRLRYSTVSATGTTVDSTLEDDEPAHSFYSGSDGGSVWYRWTAPNDNATIFSACSSGGAEPDSRLLRMIRSGTRPESGTFSRSTSTTPPVATD